MRGRARSGGHQHQVKRTSAALPFFGPVAERLGGQNPAAWGNVRFRQRCACGASREILVNGDHDERGPWVEPAVGNVTPRPCAHLTRADARRCRSEALATTETAR
ncbi:MAG: hypothetical protein Q8N53_09875 [Longimicrobiales bacterium]|nr:hypothetical protein [Longimicrobiales bacterium]